MLAKAIPGPFPPMVQFSMALLIDGYNLLHATEIFGSAVGSETVLHASRQALLEFLAAAIEAKSRGETTIVFDAAGAPPGLPRTLRHEEMTILFARRQASADEVIEELIDAHSAPHSLTVVSSDHRVQRAARRRGATYIDSDRWYVEIKASHHKQKRASQPPSKPVGQVPPDQVEYWLREFTQQDRVDDAPTDEARSLESEAGRAESSTDDPIFPPGYADDLLSDEK